MFISLCYTKPLVKRVPVQSICVVLGSMSPSFAHGDATVAAGQAEREWERWRSEGGKDGGVRVGRGGVWRSEGG